MQTLRSRIGDFSYRRDTDSYRTSQLNPMLSRIVFLIHETVQPPHHFLFFLYMLPGKKLQPPSHVRKKFIHLNYYKQPIQYAEMSNWIHVAPAFALMFAFLYKKECCVYFMYAYCNVCLYVCMLNMCSAYQPVWYGRPNAGEMPVCVCVCVSASEMMKIAWFDAWCWCVGGCERTRLPERP